MVLETLVVAIWVMLPAYIPNNVAVLAGGGRPIDGGRSWSGRRILGDGKTWRGTLFGTAAGIFVAFLLNQLHEPFATFTASTLPIFTLPAAAGLAAGAMFGDIFASFLKRRTGRARGQSFPLVDQLDFVIGALVVTAIIASDWFISTFTIPILIVVFLLTPVLHISTNILAFKLGVKNEPW